MLALRKERSRRREGGWPTDWLRPRTRHHQDIVLAGLSFVLFPFAHFPLLQCSPHHLHIRLCRRLLLSVIFAVAALGPPGQGWLVIWRLAQNYTALTPTLDPSVVWANLAWVAFWWAYWCKDAKEAQMGGWGTCALLNFSHGRFSTALNEGRKNNTLML